MNAPETSRSDELTPATNAVATRNSAAAILSRKNEWLLLGGAIALLGFDVCFFLWWRQWTWGNRLFDGPKGRVVIQRQGRLVYGSRREVLAEAQTRFTYEGKAIHPAIVQAFSARLSDSATAVMAMDVAAATDSNQYRHPVRTGKGGLHEITLETDADSGQQATFGYWYLGTLRGGVQVLETVNCGGGSGRFMDLLFLRCEVVNISGQDRLLLKYVDQFALGDRFAGEITLRGDHVAIEAQPFNRYHGLQESTNYFPRL
jgi:hypothetical protein